MTAEHAPATTVTNLPLRFGVMYECRRRPGDDTPMADIYAQHLEQAVLADQLGFEDESEIAS